jgi:hypothetical protein
VKRTETTRVSRANPPEPHLRVGASGEQAVRGGDLVPIYLVSAGLYVDDDELALVVRPELGVDIALVDIVAAPGKLLLAVAGPNRGHDLLLSLLAESVSGDAP